MIITFHSSIEAEEACVCTCNLSKRSQNNLFKILHTNHRDKRSDVLRHVARNNCGVEKIKTTMMNSN